MKLDNLEKFISDHKKDFDMVKAPKGAWSSIQLALDADEKETSDPLERYIKENRSGFDLQKAPSLVWANLQPNLEEIGNDALENFIANNKSDFDSASVHPRVWNEIEKEFGREKRKLRTARLFRISKIAAAACFLLITGTFIGSQFFNSNAQNEARENISGQIPQYEEMDKYYQGRIDNKLIQLAGYNINNEEVNDDLKKLDEVFEELKGELMNSEHENNEALINAMLKNYETKISILEQVLQKVQSGQSSKNLKNENIKI